MVIYEVNLALSRVIEKEYRAWLREHVAEILALPGFLTAQIFTIEADQPDATTPLQLSVHYQLHSRAALADYLSLHAPRLRADGVARFGDRVQATRRVLLDSTEAETLLGTQS